MKKIIASLLVTALFISGCSFFKKSPQATVNDGISAFADVKKLSSTLSLNGMIQPAAADTATSPVQFIVTATSKSDISDDKNPKGDTTFKISATSSGKTVSGDLLIRVIDKKFYANVMSIDVSGDAGTALKTQLKDVLNTWWFFPVQNGQNPAEQLSKQQKKIIENFKEAKFFVNATEEAREVVGGLNATRYRVEVDKVAIKKFLIDTINATNTETKMTADEEKQLDDSLKSVEFAGAVWIGDDEILHRVKGTVTMQAADATTRGSTFDIDYTATDFGKDIVVAVPESPKEFNPIALFPLLGAFGALDTATVPGPTDAPVVPVAPGAKNPAPAPTTPAPTTK